jgi:hypothetical protein
MNGFDSDFLLSKQSVWEPCLFDLLNQKSQGNLEIYISKDEQWNMLVIHKIPTEMFQGEESLLLLKEEIETYNHISLKKNSIWLFSQENRETKMHASALIFLETEIEKKYLNIAEQMTKTEKYKAKEIRKMLNTQCFNCQKFGHTAINCQREARCQFCAKNHSTRDHYCSECNETGRKCIHIQEKCSNCNENRSANSEKCTLYREKRQEKIQKKPANIQSRRQSNIEIQIFNTSC